MLADRPKVRELSDGRLHLSHGPIDVVLRAWGEPEAVDIAYMAVAERFAVPTDALSGKRRTRKIAQPRQIAMYLMRQLTDLSLVDIGRYFGGRDHTTVIYACAKVSEQAATDNVFAERLNALFSTLATG